MHLSSFHLTTAYLLRLPVRPKNFEPLMQSEQGGALVAV